jgi:hypothetical protein
MLAVLLGLVVVTGVLVLPALIIPARERLLADQLELQERADAIRTNMRRMRADAIYRTQLFT